MEELRIPPEVLKNKKATIAMIKLNWKKGSNSAIIYTGEAYKYKNFAHFYVNKIEELAFTYKISEDIGISTR